MSNSKQCLKVKGVYSSSWQTHSGATEERHLPYGITLDIDELVPPKPSQAGQYFIHLPRCRI